jgi:hypothetical protein
MAVLQDNAKQSDVAVCISHESRRKRHNAVNDIIKFLATLHRKSNIPRF